MADTLTRRVAITGASGYIGGLVARRYEQAGWRVVSLRRPAAPAGAGVGEKRPFTLGQPLDPEELRDVQVLIHCAYDFSLTEWEDIRRVNVVGTQQLLAAATTAGVGRVLYVSSMSAYDGTTQIYGRAKLACEAAVAAVGGTSVRLGLVYGDGWGGMAGSLRRLVRLPVVPLVGAHSYQFTVHEADVTQALFALGTSQTPPSRPLTLAHPDPVPFKRLLEGFARHAGARPHFVSVPWRPVYAAMRAAERAHLPLPLRADSLLGLVRPAPDLPQSGDWAKLGVPIRAFDL